MTDYIESDGWAILTNGTDTLKFYCEKFKFRLKYKGKAKHYDGKVNLGIPIMKKWVEGFIENAWLDSITKVHNLLTYIPSWQEAGTLKLKFQYNTGGSFVQMDGTNTTFPVYVMDDIGWIEKVGNGNQTVFVVTKLQFEQTGTAS